MLEKAPVGEVVFDDQEAFAGQLGLLQLPGGRRQCRRGLRQHREMKRGPLLRRAFHPDLPAQQLRQTLANRQAQPGAPVMPRGRGVHLLEGFEQPALLLQRDSDARCPGRRNATATPRGCRRISVSCSCPGSTARAPCAAGVTSTTTSPACVNLTALPTRLTRICRRRVTSLTRIFGMLSSTTYARSSFFSSRRGREQVQRLLDARVELERMALQLQLSRFDL